MTTPDDAAREHSVDPFVALHRYFVWANRFRALFNRELAMRAARGETESTGTDSAAELFVEDIGLFMVHWYAALYVVIEGYTELRLSEPAVDALLTSSHVDLLKRFRNGAYHFQKNYFDARFMEFMAAPDVVSWVRTLNSEMGRFFLEQIAARREAAGGRDDA